VTGHRPGADIATRPLGPAVQEVLCAGGINHLDREHVEPLMRALITEIPPPASVAPSIPGEAQPHGRATPG